IILRSFDLLRQNAEQHYFFSQQMVMNMSILQMNKFALDHKISSIATENPFIDYRSFKDHLSSGKTVLPEIIEQTLAAQKTLYDNLREELLLDLDEDDFHLLQLIIGNTDRFGFLQVSTKDLCYGTSIDQDRLEYVRAKIMSSSEYLGLASYNYKEYLLFISKTIYGNNSLEYKIVELITLKKNKTPSSIQRHLKVPLKNITTSLDKINLLPKSPLQEESIALLPDIIIKTEENNILITPINYGSSITNTEINTDHLEYNSKELKNFKKEALELQKALDLRNSALEIYATILINSRKDFFIPEENKEPVSINLKIIAEQTNRNISTVSRALKDRYFYFNGHIYAFSDLLTRTIGNSNDFEIKKQIKALLSKESADSPLTDSIIVDILNKKGINIARRTVAKYRDQLHIGSVYQR
ncbi:MAG: hypothetical protein ACRCTJ_06580, partial [Brevinema sp.]